MFEAAIRVVLGVVNTVGSPISELGCPHRLSAPVSFYDAAKYICP